MLCFLIPSIAWAKTHPRSHVLREEIYPINIQYQSAKQFPFLQQKVGLTMGIAPFKDTSHGRLYVGHYIHQRVSNYLKSEPLPLEKAIRDSLLQPLSLHGIKTVPISSWDGKEESLKDTEVDSILMIEIMRFWAEGIVSARGTNVNTSIYLIIRLGVKKEDKVFRRDMYTIKENSIIELTPAGVEKMINQTLTEILDAFFSNPY
jgi:hypothetical protein